jgi:YD repeat-containing protein
VYHLHSKLQHNFYEGDGSVNLTVDALGNKSQSYFDAARNVTRTVDGRGFATFYVYNADNEQTAVTDPNGNTARTQYNAAWQVVASYDAVVTGEATGKRPR